MTGSRLDSRPPCRTRTTASGGRRPAWTCRDGLRFGHAGHGTERRGGLRRRRPYRQPARPIDSAAVDPRTGLPVVGMVGAGQLARMTHQAAIALGQSLRLLAESPSDGAALVADDVVVGDYRSLPDLRGFAGGCDVLTFDHEHVPAEHLRALAEAGVSVLPGAGGVAASPRTRRRCGPGWPSWACPGRPGGPVGRGRPVGRRWPSSPTRSAGRWWSRRSAAAMTARASGCRSDVEPAEAGGPACWPAAPGCWSRRRPTSTSRSPRWWPARRSARARPGRWWRPSSRTASAPR